MIKLRLWGLPEDVKTAIDVIEKAFDVHFQSDLYNDRQGDYVRAYLECEVKSNDNIQHK